MIKKTNVIAYFTGNKEKDKKIISYCKKNNLKIIDSIMKDPTPTVSWNPSIYKLFGLVDNDKVKLLNIENIITYSLEDLDHCINYQMSICHYLGEIGLWVNTLEEGKFFTDYEFDCHIERKD